jgi:photosystem II stability/assembly factor-like uncharacterized protein
MGTIECSSIKIYDGSQWRELRGSKIYDGTAWRNIGTGFAMYNGVDWLRLKEENVQDELMIVGDSGVILTSQDGITWTQRTSGVTRDLQDACYGDGIWVVVGNNGIILTSPDGITWTPRTSGTTDMLRSVCYGDGIWVAVGNVGLILTSPDGINWTQRTSGVTGTLMGITYHNNVFAASGYGTGVILTSTNNGIDWSTVISNSSLIVRIHYANGMFVCISSSVYYSYDGINWSSLSFINNNNGCYVLNYGNGKWIFGTNKMFSAPGDDFTQWTEIQSLSDLVFTWHDAVYSNGKWYIVGRDASNYAKMMTSIDDGQTWVDVPFSYRTFSGIAKKTIV